MKKERGKMYYFTALIDKKYGVKMIMRATQAIMCMYAGMRTPLMYEEEKYYCFLSSINNDNIGDFYAGIQLLRNHEELDKIIRFEFQNDSSFDSKNCISEEEFMKIAEEIIEKK